MLRLEDSVIFVSRSLCVILRTNYSILLRLFQVIAQFAAASQSCGEPRLIYPHEVLSRVFLETATEGLQGALPEAGKYRRVFAWLRRAGWINEAGCDL